jgi:hypothetical protein
MAKKSTKAKAEAKTKVEAPKEWTLSTSQQLLLKEQARHHQNELAPFLAYQERSRNDLLNSFRTELGVPEDVILNVDLQNMRFTERGSFQPVAVPDPPK